MLEMCERWSNWETVHRDLWGLKIFDDNGDWHMAGIVCVEDIWDAKACLEEWLEKRRAGKLGEK